MDIWKNMGDAPDIYTKPKTAANNFEHRIHPSVLQNLTENVETS